MLFSSVNIIQGNNIFLITNPLGYKIIVDKRSIQGERYISSYFNAWIHTLTQSSYFKEYKKFIDMVCDWILQLTLKKLPLVEFWYNIKEEYFELS